MGQQTDDLLALRRQHISNAILSTTDLYIERALNSELWDVEGRRYIDFAGGIGALSVGHCHPRIIAAVEKQLKKFTHGAFQVAAYPSAIELCEMLNAVAPGRSVKKSVLFSTGSEAIENAIKCARAYTGRQGLVAFRGGFHGRTLTALSLIGKVKPYKVGLGPLNSHVYHVPFPDPYRGISEAAALFALDELFESSIEAKDVAALVIEPVQGEGGFRVASPGFFQALRQRCTEHGIVLIVDEVQSGFGRTGTLLAVEHAGIEPDITVVAKSLSGGLPLSGLVGKQVIMDAPQAGAIGSTYAANPLGCVAALEVFKVLRDEQLLSRAQVLGQQLRDFFERMAATDVGRYIGDVRGLGAMIGVEFVSDGEQKTPAADYLKALRQQALSNGLVTMPSGIYGNVLRFLMPLTISDATLQEGLGMLEAAMTALV